MFEGGGEGCLTVLGGLGALGFLGLSLFSDVKSLRVSLVGPST